MWRRWRPQKSGETTRLYIPYSKATLHILRKVRVRKAGVLSPGPTKGIRLLSCRISFKKRTLESPQGKLSLHLILVRFFLEWGIIIISARATVVRTPQYQRFPDIFNGLLSLGESHGVGFSQTSNSFFSLEPISSNIPRVCFQRTVSSFTERWPKTW
jgi:hypothetical protein